MPSILIITVTAVAATLLTLADACRRQPNRRSLTRPLAGTAVVLCGGCYATVTLLLVLGSSHV
jgi:hypothetical protein